MGQLSALSYFWPYLLVMVTGVLADLVGSAWLTALTVTRDGDGMELGAARSPLAPILPTMLLPPTTPLTVQMTEVFAECSCAVNCLLRPRRTLDLTGEIVTLIGVGFTTVTDALPTAEVIAWLVACTVTGVAAGTAGGEYKGPER